jgi:tetratricopeptide (TPR) repeat protein
MSVRWLAVRAAAAAALVVGSTAWAAATPPYYETLANVESGDKDDDGASWFETWDDGMRFVLEPKYGDRSDAMWELLRDSYEGGVAAKVKFDVSAARFDPKAENFRYPICSVEIGGRLFQSGRSCDRASYSPSSAEAEIALALGEFVSGSPRAAIARLNKALSNATIKPPMLKVALHARAQSYEAVGESQLPQSDDADRANVAALADYRKLSALAPSAKYFKYRTGLMLQELGDYASARSIFRQIQKQYPDDDFNNTLSLATLEREAGNAEESLKLLNDLVERQGPQDNMRYYYHRGWTLNALGRYDEAIAALTAGVEDQPDYAFAYLRRACAYANVGRLADAANDYDSAAGHLAAVLKSEIDPSIDFNIERAKNAALRLRAAIAAGKAESMPDVCRGFWGDNDRPRSRSPLLPA